ncbi:MAG: DUF1707 domain-containing protein [Propionibacteriaceae bacterium]|jgi:hypothetical protein|nr:DUF1707 domain-containing protein [Propionibacteriaceae bacterium]
MSSEPNDVGPLFGGNQPASDHDRQLVYNLLTCAHADRRLTDWDFNQRMAACSQARFFDDLLPLTRDLMV